MVAEEAHNLLVTGSIPVPAKLLIKGYIMYTPEEWILIKINSDDPHYRVFGSWRGGYLNGDSWKMNSGVTSVEMKGDYYLFNGASGSVYKCHKKAYGIRSPYNNSVLHDYKKKLKDKFEIFTKVPKIMEINWGL